DLVGARRLEDDRELGLLLLRRRPLAAARCGGRTGDCDRSRLDAPLVLERLGELDDLHHRQAAQILDYLLLRYLSHGRWSSNCLGLLEPRNARCELVLNRNFDFGFPPQEPPAPRARSRA